MQHKSESIKIVLIGDPKQKQKFVAAVSNNIFSTFELDFFRARGSNKDYDIWNMPYQNSSIIHNYTKDSKVIIYFDPTQELQVKFETKRDVKNCLAINFNAVGLEPQELLNNIELFMQEHQNDLFKLNLLINKSKFLFFANTDQKSIISILPKELISNIGHTMLNNAVFDLRTHNKPIYIAAPLTAKANDSEIKCKPSAKADDSETHNNSCIIS